MDETHIGLLSPEGTNSNHFRNFEKLLPPEIQLSIEGLELARSSRYELAGKADVILGRARQFAQKLPLQGLILTGAPVAILNPGLDAQVSQALGIPVVTAGLILHRGTEGSWRKKTRRNDAFRCANERKTNKRT